MKQSWEENTARSSQGLLVYVQQVEVALVLTSSSGAYLEMPFTSAYDVVWALKRHLNRFMESSTVQDPLSDMLDASFESRPQVTDEGTIVHAMCYLLLPSNLE